MRAALLPTPGDPYMLAYWLRNFETWAEHVDVLVVYINGQADPELAERCRDMLMHFAGAPTRLIYSPERVGHNQAIRALLEYSDEPYVVLCEDDAYVRKPHAVKFMFNRIETGEVDVIGSPRQENYADSVIETEWGPLTTDPGELVRGLWPAFLFIHRDNLLATDRDFGDRVWRLGETITGTDIVVTPEVCKAVGIAPDFVHLDVMFSTTFQLRAMGLRIGLVNRVRVFDAKATEEWVKYDPPWFHVTGLSTMDEWVIPPRASLEGIPDMGSGGGLWTRRIAWALRMADTSDDEDVWDALQQFIDATDMDSAEIADWDARFGPWVTWNENAAVPA